MAVDHGRVATDGTRDLYTRRLHFVSLAVLLAAVIACIALSALIPPGHDDLVLFLAQVGGGMLLLGLLIVIRHGSGRRLPVPREPSSRLIPQMRSRRLRWGLISLLGVLYLVALSRVDGDQSNVTVTGVVAGILLMATLLVLRGLDDPITTP